VRTEAGVVDKRVDLPVCDGCDEVLQTRVGTQIADDQLDVDARRLLLDALTRLLQPRRVPAGQHQRRAALGQLLGEHRAQPRTRTRHDGPAASMSLRHRPTPSNVDAVNTN
jgi:hypothetical protein